MKRSKIIEELVDKSTTTSNSYDDRFGNTITTFFDKDKFAELIIKECCQLNYDFNESYRNACEVNSEIRSHFGVKP